MPDGRTRSIILLLIAAVLWSLGGIFIKSIDLPPLALAGCRSFVAAFFLFLFLRPFHITRSFPLWGAAICYAGTVILFVAATKWTTAANAILLQYTAPVYVALIAPWFLGERTRGRDWAMMACALAGMTLFFAEKLELNGLQGNITALVSGLFFAGFTLFLRKQKRNQAIEAIFLGNCIAGVIALPAIVGSHPSGQALGALAVMGVVQLALPYVLFAKAIQHVTALEAMMIPFIEPILNPVWVLLLRGEKPSFYALVGGSIILGSVMARAIVGARTPSQDL